MWTYDKQIGKADVKYYTAQFFFEHRSIIFVLYIF